MSETVKKPGLGKRIAKWYKELKSEAKKIVWPSRKQLINNTIIVLVVVVVTAIIIGLLDIGFGKLVELVLSIF